MATNDEGGSVFAKYVADVPERREPETASPTDLRLLPAGRFLNWLLNYWDKSTISAFEIYTYGPRPIKNLKEAMSVAEILVQQGWFIPLRAHRHDRKLWQIVRETKQQTTTDQKLRAATG